MRKIFSLAKIGAAALLLTSLTSCEDVLEQYFPKPTPPPTTPTFPSLGLDIPFYTLSSGTKLDAYSTKDPNTRTNSVSITGLQGGETLLAIDFRPATGQLYGVSSGSRLYVINQKTGAARAIGAGAFSPALGGNLVGFDFNPTVDRIRLVTSTGQNLRLNPETGTVAATDGNVNGAAGATLTGVAYTNNTAGASTTALYAINTQNQQLYLVNPPNDGTVVPVGALNLPVSGDGGFDIDAKTGTALGLYTVAGRPTLFSVNLNTGAAQPLAQYAANAGYTGIAIPTQPVAYAVTTIVGANDTYGRTNNTLLIFDPTNPSSIISKPITGLINAGLEFETINGLDFRPATGQLYAFVEQFRSASDYASDSRIYTINTATGVATLVAVINGPPLPFYHRTRFLASQFGFDFNPVSDQIRLLYDSPNAIDTNTGPYASGNNRIDPVTGRLTFDTSPAQPGATAGINIYAAAYDNNFVGTTTTNLYVINQQTGKLYLQNPPNEGTLTEIGSLGVTLQNYGGFLRESNFDIGGNSNIGYALLPVGGATKLYSINLSTGTATSAGGAEFPGIVAGLAVGLGF